MQSAYPTHYRAFLYHRLRPQRLLLSQLKTTQLTIKGRWLEQLGFYAGQAVVVKIERNKLIIELAMQL